MVVDSEDLMTRPAAIIQAYCARAGIDFRPEALTWQPSDRLADPRTRSGNCATRNCVATFPRKRSDDHSAPSAAGSYGLPSVPVPDAFAADAVDTSHY